MNKTKAEDKDLYLSHLLHLLWGVHSKYEGLNKKEAVLYRVEMKTFLIEMLEEVKELMKTLEIKDECSDDLLE